MLTAGRRACLVAFLLAPNLAAAAEPSARSLLATDTSLCHHVDMGVPLAVSPSEAGVTTFSADNAQTSGQDIVIMHGNAEAVHDGQLLRSDRATYDRSADTVQAEGNVQYRREGLSITGDRADLNLGTDSGRLDNAKFSLAERHARGSAGTVLMLDRNVTVLNRATYTTCNPGNEDWILRAGRVRLDQSTGTGTATNVSVSFMGVPFLYSPWLSFPIDNRRKTGFLPPTVGQSSDNGVELTIPYYLNLDPQYDLTLTPRYLSRRGLLLGSEFRYLTTASRGAVDLEYLPNDRLTGEDRSLVRYLDDGHPLSGLTTNVEYNLASDANYFRDLGNSLNIASITHLDQHAAVAYQADTWTASARVQAYQTVDDTIPRASRPYKELPALFLRTQRPEYDLRPNFRLITSYIDFQHSDLTSGQRVDVQPAVSLPLYSPAAYLQPTITLRHTRYVLDRDTPGDGRTPQRTLPIYSVDSGVFLERDTRWDGRDLIQTLEPRLYYLYVPYRDQSDLPLFDTGTPDFTFSQLFRDNRFNGSDRVGDTNQIAAALTTRFLDGDTGQQRAQAGIGQIYYFQDRRITLTGTPDTAPASDIVATAAANFSKAVTGTLDLRRSEDTGKLDMAGVQIRYKPEQRSVLNLSYRYREATPSQAALDQSDVSLLWPIGPRWHIIARHNYSFLDHQELETLAGVEYQSCCWRVRVVHRRYLNSELNSHNQIIYLQLDLIGLATVGDHLDSLLDRGILGN